ncbi:MAG: ATP-dependent helicase HrpB [Lentisphaerae bacterium]|nr:ATP-dependent helicase HrpB [Lentisphaerota bacterium]
MKDFPQLPLWHKLGEIKAAFKEYRSAVIEAEPGAGKTMLVPVLAKECCAENPGLTILVAPRRIAVRAAASGIAALHALQMGQDTGYTVRGESCRCQKDGILAVTPGILLQMLQSDPELTGVSALIFDEFHERSLELDLALTLTMDMRSTLREDLLLAVMSATMDSGMVGRFLNAPVIKVPGRGFPVEISYRESSADIRDMAKECAKAVMENAFDGDGNILVFLPGTGEINKCAEMLRDFAAEKFALRQLHGTLPLDEQRTATAPESDGRRKIILATNVAESSLTIEGVTLVIDSGWEKKSVWSPGAQMNFLELRRITRDSAIQRAGRAGRTAPGRAVRCYSKVTFDNLIPHAEAEILSADLTGLLLAIGCWGSSCDALMWLDAPPEAAVAAGKNILRQLQLFSADDRPTDSGKKAAQLPVTPRIAAMMLHAPASMRRMAAELAGILEEKDQFHRFNSADLLCRTDAMHRDRNSYRIQNQIAERLLKEFPESSGEKFTPGILIALAFPEWIAARREKNGTVYQLASGSAAKVQDDDPLRQEEFLAVARLDGSGGGNSVIRLALALDGTELEKFFADRITERKVTRFADGRIISAIERTLGETVLKSRSCAVDPAEAAKAVVKEALRREMALPPAEDKRAAALAKRLAFAKKCGMDEVPELDGNFFIACAETFPENVTSLAALKKIDWYTVLKNNIGCQLLSEVDRLCPEYFTAPAGMKFPIDYSGEQPSLAIQIQQLYGVKTHPAVGKNRMPLRIELLSPAHRPVQISCDLPGFWQGTWKLVRSEMRSRYPKHVWHEDPANAEPMRSSVKKRQ